MVTYPGTRWCGVSRYTLASGGLPNRPWLQRTSTWPSTVTVAPAARSRTWACQRTWGWPASSPQTSMRFSS